MFEQIYNFIGTVDSLTSDYSMGDIVINDGKVYCYVNSEWVLMSSFDGEEPVEKHAPITECPHCGASVDPYLRKCSYCGSYMKGGMNAVC